MKYILPILLCLPLSVIMGQSNAQYIIASQGGQTTGKTMSISWTIGDLATSSEVFGKGILTQGFQQPFISVKEINPADDHHAITDADIHSFNARVYPNPFQDEVVIDIANHQKEYTVEIFDNNGRLISTRKSDQSKQSILLSQLPAAQYTLRISFDDKEDFRTFKILKSN